MVKLTEWDHFLCKVQKYRNNDFEKFVQDKKYFDKVLERLSHIADDGLTLIPNVVTKIIKDHSSNNKSIVFIGDSLHRQSYDAFISEIMRQSDDKALMFYYSVL
jgi:uncharacterized Fe-S cluster-containing radical SAM superfamily protein